MAKILKIIGMVLLALLILLIGTAVAVAIWFDPNDYKHYLEERVEQETGRQLTIEGDISLSFFPWIGVEVGQTRLANAAAFGEAPFARWETAQLRVRLLPLLWREVEMDTVTLLGMHLNLARDGDGRTNWDDMLEHRPAPPEEPDIVDEPPDEPRPPTEPLAALAQLTVAGVRLHDAQVEWDDALAGTQYTLRDLGVRTGGIRPEESFPVELHFELDTPEPALRADVALSGEAVVDPRGPGFRLDNGRLDVRADGDDVPGGTQSIRARFNAAFDMGADTADLTGLRLDALGMRVLGEVRGRRLTQDYEVAGQLRSESFNPRAVLAALGQEDPVTTDPRALTGAEFSLRFHMTPEGLDMEHLEATLDDTVLQAAASVTDFDNPAIRVDANVDAIDLDRYLPPPADDAPEEAAGGVPPAGAGAAAGGAAELPLEPLRELDLVAQLAVERIKVSNLTATEMRAELTARDGQLRLHPVEARIYEGRYRGDVRLDVRGDEPRIQMDERVEEVQAGPFLKDLLGTEAERLTGIGNVHAQLETRGADDHALRRNLNGQINFAFRDGVFYGFDLGRVIRAAHARITDGAAPDAGDATRFSELRGTLTVRDGVVRSEDLDATTGFLNIKGRGQVDLADETIDYLLNGVLTDLPDGAGSSLQELKGITLPIRVTGPLAEPEVRLDLRAALSEAQQERLRQEREKLEERLEDEIRERLDPEGLGDRLRDGVRDLFR